MGDLIPGLPDDVATECLIRVHYESFTNAILTCKKWKHEMESPQYLRRRIMGGHNQSVVVMTQIGFGWDVVPEREPGIIRLVVCELKTGSWRELPPIPGYSRAFPFLCRLAVVGLNLMVIGGCRPRSLSGSKKVFIYSFISNTWRRGADMLDARLNFECASNSDRTVYVVGGSDDEGNEMMSALSYDVAKDEWIRLPDMATEVAVGFRLKATFQSGKLHLFSIGSRGESKQILNAQSFDPAMWTYGPVCKYLLDIGFMFRVKVAGEVENVYVCGGGAVSVIQNGKCQKVADFCVVEFFDLMTWNNHLVVIGYVENRPSDSSIVVCLLDLESKEWSILEAPWGYSGVFNFACNSEI